MKRLLCIIAFGVSGLSSAGQLDDANGLLIAKQYDKAFTAYANLAKAGDTEAQFRLGEMYWYGDGTAPDLKSAIVWLSKASERGHGGAIEALAILKQRETRAADIAYWTAAYSGEDLITGRFDCPAPAIPALSVTADEIRDTAGSYKAWQACYNGFVANIKSVPLGKRIPADVAGLMTPREAEQALAHLDAVYDRIVAQSNQRALAISSEYVKWEASTERRIADNNIGNMLEYEILQRRRDEAQLRFIQNPRTSVPAPTPAPSK